MVMTASATSPHNGPGGGLMAATAPNGGSTHSTDFESFYHAVCSELQNQGEVHSMSKAFAQLTTDEDRIRFLIEKNFAQTHLQLGAGAGKKANNGHSGTPNNAGWWREFNFKHKDRAESQRLRNLGNQVYQKNRLSEALEYYTQSISAAPHPPPPNSFLLHGTEAEDTFSHEELALGYANRSAVLFQMKEYDLCIRDITRAFDNSYPNNLMYKLFERKARCSKALKDFPRALESMKSAEMWMKHSTLSETKNSSFKKEITKQVEFLEDKVGQMKIQDFTETAENRKNIITPVKVLEPPKFPGEENAELPGARKEIQLVYTEDKGRHLIATEDISPGEILMVENPYSSILLPEFYSTHCQTCFHRTIAPIPCWCCATVRFCCDECRSEAWERFHKVECQQLNLILNSGVGKNAMLAFRILTSSGKIYLEYVINKVHEEMENRKKNPSNDRQFGFNEEGVYDPADYRTIYCLIANTKHRGVGDLFKRSLMAVYLLKILEMTPFFYNGGSDPRNVKLQDKVGMGAVILKHLQNLPCNAHEITEMELAGVANNARDSTVHEIGAASFGLLSLLNHSCDPNVVRHYYSNNSVVRAIRTIKKGEEILDNYGYHYAVMPKEERQRKLHNQYYFHCTCFACNHNWTIYTSLNPSPVALPSLSPQEQKSTLSELQKSSKLYKKSFEGVLQGHFKDSQPVLLEHLRFLDQYISRPYREYNDCQEAIKQCYSATANCYRSKSSAPVGKKEKDVIV
eukprot:maker-scaffold580_size130538-snap-gene-0.31 protein:Tk07491 transcript:maker-scaffold580_size130538-snap-gene-0.31-mRNA-1 annotation:"set and mynd domain-containing protein 4-like"